MDENRQCRRCSKTLPIESFYKQKNGNYRWICRPCCRKQRYDEHGAGVFKPVIHNFVYGVKA